MDGGRLDFITTREGIDPPLLAVEANPAPGEVDPVAALFEQNGPLTLLEVFLAVAPPGVEPHPVLVQSHASEARVLGRADGAVRAAKFATTPFVSSLDPLVEKALPPNPEEICRPQLFSSDRSNVWTRVTLQLSSSSFPGDVVYLCAGGEANVWLDSDTNVCTRDSFTQPLRAGMCHVDPDSPSLVLEFWAATTGDLFLFRSGVLRASNTPQSLTLAASAAPQRLAVVRHSPIDIAADVMGSGVSEPP